MAFSQSQRRRVSALFAGAAIGALPLAGGLAVTLMSAGDALAQAETNGSFVANVTDADGRPVAGARIVLRNQALGLTRTLTTDAGGVARASQIPTGGYTATISMSGYDTLTETDLQVQLGGDSTFPLQLLRPGAAGKQAIVVTGKRRNPQLDFSRATLGATYDITQLQKTIPVARNLTAVALLTPGVSLPVSGFSNTDGSPVPVIGGSSAGENAFYINGLNITNFDTYIGASVVPFDFYQNVQVFTAGLPAEYGRSTGGVLNATTKAGTNDFHFGIHEYYSPNATRSTSPNTYLAANSEAQDTQNQLVFEGGGPVIKDHVFLYGLYQLNDRVQENASIVNSTLSKTRTASPFYGYKADVFLTAKQHLEFTDFNTTQVRSIRAFGFNPTTFARGGELGGTTLKNGGNNYVAKYTGTFTDWFTLSGAYGHSNDENYNFPSTAGGSYVSDGRSPTSNTQVRISPTTAANSSQNFDNTHREFYRADGDFTFNFFGHHHVRVGFDHENTELDHSTSLSGGALYALSQVKTAATATRLGLALGQDYTMVTTERLGGQAVTGENESYYIQDAWDITKQLSVNIGLRDDNFDLNNLQGQRAISLDQNYGPRAQVIYDPFGAGMDKLSFSYSRVFIPPASNLSFRGADQYFIAYFLPPAGLSFSPYLNPTTKVPTTGAQLTVASNPRFTAAAGATATCPGGGLATAGVAGCTVYGDGTQTPANSLAALDLQATQEDVFTLGYEHKLNNLTKVFASFAYRTLDSASEDVAVDNAILRYCARNPTFRGCNDPNLADVLGGDADYVVMNPGRSTTIKVRSDLPIALAGQNITLSADDLQNPKPIRKDFQLVFGFDRTFDGRWGLGASYTLEFLRGNYEGTVKSDAGNTAQTDAGSTQEFDHPGLEEFTLGSLPNERRHSFKIYGSYSPLKGLLFGINALIQSPRQYGCIGYYPNTGTILNDPYGAEYRAASRYCVDPATGLSRPVPRGSAFEGDWTSEVDLQARYTVPRFNKYVPDGLSFRVEVFNLFDSSSATQNDEVGDSSAAQASTTYGLPIQYQQPRYVRFGFDLVY